MFSRNPSSNDISSIGPILTYKNKSTISLTLPHRVNAKKALNRLTYLLSTRHNSKGTFPKHENGSITREAVTLLRNKSHPYVHTVRMCQIEILQINTWKQTGTEWRVCSTRLGFGTLRTTGRELVHGQIRTVENVAEETTL